MPIDTSIIGRLMPAQFKVADPLEAAQKSLALQGLMGQQDMQAMAMKQAQQAEADDLATREAFKAGGERSAIVQRLLGAGQWKAAQAVEKAGLDADKAKGDIAKTTTEVEAARAKQGRDLIASASPQNYQTIIAEGRRLGQKWAENAPAQFDPVWQRQNVIGADKWLEVNAPKFTQVQDGGVTRMIDQNSFTNPTVGAQTFSRADPGKDLVLPGAGGVYAPNQPLIAAKTGIARAGASNTNVSVNTAEKPFLTQLGEGVGKNIISDFDQARAAVNTLNNASQIERSLGNVIAGPGANARVTLAQIGQTLGINGANATEQLVNTRNAIQGLARQELAAAGQMKGQGQITEAERGILRRAEAGDISEMTVPELRTFLTAIRKTANYKIGLHNTNLSRLKQNPNAAPVVDFLQVATPDQAPAAADPGAVDAALQKHLPRKP
jgi:hypothetical protein